MNLTRILILKLDLPFTSIPSSIFSLLMRRGMWPPRAERDGAPARATRASRRRCARFFTVATCTSMKIDNKYTFKPLATACLLRDLNTTSRSSDFSSALALRKDCLMASFRPFCVSKLTAGEVEEDDEDEDAGVRFDEKCVSLMCTNSARVVEKRGDLA